MYHLTLICKKTGLHIKIRFGVFLFVICADQYINTEKNQTKSRRTKTAGVKGSKIFKIVRMVLGEKFQKLYFN